MNQKPPKGIKIFEPFDPTWLVELARVQYPQDEWLAAGTRRIHIVQSPG